MNPLHVKIGLFTALLLLTLYMVLILVGDNGLRELNAMKRELSVLKAENKNLARQNQQLYRQVQRMKEDPEFAESIIREKLKMVAKDEIVFKFKKQEEAQ